MAEHLASIQLVRQLATTVSAALHNQTEMVNFVICHSLSRTVIIFLNYSVNVKMLTD